MFKKVKNIFSSLFKTKSTGQLKKPYNITVYNQIGTQIETEWDANKEAYGYVIEEYSTIRNMWLGQDKKKIYYSYKSVSNAIVNLDYANRFLKVRPIYRIRPIYVSNEIAYKQLIYNEIIKKTKN